MKKQAVGQVSAVMIAVASALLLACGADAPCPPGHELREVRYSPDRIKSRGCVIRDADSNYRLAGRWVFYHPTGARLAEGVYKNAYAGGEKGKTGVLRDGREGLWVFYHPNGRKDWEVAYRHGKAEGPFAAWHDNGRKRQEGTYRDGKREGSWVMWRPNGQKAQVATFAADQVVAGSVKAWEDPTLERTANPSR